MKNILLTILILIITMVDSVAEPDLYSGEVIVASQAATARNEAIPEALIRVLQKLSGRRELPLSPALDKALANAERILLSFQYRSVDRAGPNGNTQQELRLIARFMPSEVDRVVQQIGLPRWQQDRPPVQLWVVLDDGRGRHLKPVEYDYAWVAIEDVAAFRGLPIIWPNPDEEEIQLLDMSLVWGGFTDYLIEHGAPESGVAIVSARREGPRWILRWNLTAGGKNWSWRSTDHELMFALVEGIHRMTEQLASINVIAASEQDHWMIDVIIGGLSDASAYIQCLEYLQGLSLVTAVNVLTAEPGRVQFRMQLNASPKYLFEVFNRGVVLLPAGTGGDYEYEFLH